MLKVRKTIATQARRQIGRLEPCCTIPAKGTVGTKKEVPENVRELSQWRLGHPMYRAIYQYAEAIANFSLTALFVYNIKKECACYFTQCTRRVCKSSTVPPA